MTAKLAQKKIRGFKILIKKHLIKKQKAAFQQLL